MATGDDGKQMSKNPAARKPDAKAAQAAKETSDGQEATDGSPVDDAVPEAEDQSPADCETLVHDAVFGENGDAQGIDAAGRDATVRVAETGSLGAAETVAKEALRITDDAHVVAICSHQKSARKGE